MALLRRLSFIMVLLTFIGCGGGDGGFNTGGDGNGDDGSTDVPYLEVTLSGEAVSEAEPLSITAKVMRGDAPVVGKLVTFTLSDDELAFFEPTNGAKSTGSDGIAAVTLHAGSKAGGGNIFVSTTVDGETLSFEVAFDSAGDGNTGGVRQVATIDLFADSQQLASSGADEINLTAIVKDNNNNLLEGAEVVFSANSGSIQTIKTITEADGKATALLKTEGNSENRVVNVTVQSDNQQDSINIAVIGTTITINGSSALAIGDENNFVVKVLDSDGNGIAEQTVALALQSEPNSNGVADVTIPASVTTDFTGQARFQVTGNTGGSNAIIASALGAEFNKAVSVQADSFLYTEFNNNSGDIVNPTSTAVPDVFLSKSAQVTLTWLRSGVPVADGTPVSFTTTRGSLVANNATTVDGKVTAHITSANAGRAILTFTGVDGNIELSNQLEFEFVAETAHRLVAQASPKSIGPSEQTSTISVVVKDVNGNLVKNKAIDFSLEDTSGGSIFPASAVTDSNGSASTVYTSKTVSAQNGVKITATVRETPSVNDVVELTVAERELFIAIGTGNTIEESHETTYTKRFVAFVTDIDSNPVADQELTISAVPERFYKGQWVPIYRDEAGGAFLQWAAVGERRDPVNTSGFLYSDYFSKHACPNEDSNIDGIMDPNEDTNGDGQLTPGNVLSSLATVSVEDGDQALVEAVTDQEGKIIIDMIYPQSMAEWVDIRLIVSGKVSGTESFTQTVFTLPVAAEDVLDEDITPPLQNVGNIAPWGLIADCTNID
ncbi:Ig-like domain-containing protein [Thalassotalea ganghwensis]